MPENRGSFFETFLKLLQAISRMDGSVPKNRPVNKVRLVRIYPSRGNRVVLNVIDYVDSAGKPFDFAFVAN